MKYILVCILKSHKNGKLFSMLYFFHLCGRLCFVLEIVKRVYITYAVFNTTQRYIHLGPFKNFPNKNPKLFHNYLEKPPFSKSA